MMKKSSALRVALAADSVSIWSPEIFGGAGTERVRSFLARAFAVPEVQRVELRRASAFGRIRYAAVTSPAQIWKKLSRALSAPEAPSPLDAVALPGQVEATGQIDTTLLYLDVPEALPVRVSRIGAALSTWRVQKQSGDTLRLSHPRLRNRRDVVFRLEEELTALFGVEEFRASALTAEVSIRFDCSATNPERLARELERAWPRLLEGLDGPPSQKRLLASFGLLGLAYTGQYVVPALRPIAVAGVTLYSAPNVVSAVKQLARGQVGVSALYSTGLAFMLVSGMPFTASVMASLMQLWPQLAQRKLVRSQRRLFAGQRRRPAWARKLGTAGEELEVGIDALGKGDRILVRQGEVVPVDGVVEDGAAALIDAAAVGGGPQVEDRWRGDAVAAGALVHDGMLTIRVERAGTQTDASYVDSLLPHGALVGLPCSLEAERIANRNAKPALLLAALSLWATHLPLPAQAVIRPDYATGPRLSAQLSVLHGIGRGLLQGALFNPAALDRLASANVLVLDDGADLALRRVAVAGVQAVDGVAAELVVGLALSAQPVPLSEQSRALETFVAGAAGSVGKLASIERRAGVVRGRDPSGALIEVAASRHVAASKLTIPERLPVVYGTALPGGGVDAELADPSLRLLWVLRDGELLGVVSFARTGESVGGQLVTALRAQGRSVRIVQVSRRDSPEARASARALDIEFHGGLSPSAKVQVVHGLGGKALWVGDGSDPDARPPISASALSVSVAPLARARQDAADILLPQRGLAGLPELLDVGRAHAQRRAADYRTIYTTNLLGVAGAYVASFTGMQSGLLSNLGTGLIYARHARALDLLASTAEARRAQREIRALR